MTGVYVGLTSIVTALVFVAGCNAHLSSPTPTVAQQPTITLIHAQTEQTPLRTHTTQTSAVLTADISTPSEVILPCVELPQLVDSHVSEKPLPDEPVEPVDTEPSHLALSPLRFSKVSLSGDPTEEPATENSHFGEIRGLVHSVTGKRLTMLPLVGTSARFPEVGSKGELWVNISSSGDNYALLARVRIVSAVEVGATVELDILNDEETGENIILMRKLENGQDIRLEYIW